MNESLHTIVMAVSAIIFLCLLFALVRIINGAQDLEWSDLVSSRTAEGKQRADWNKIGQGGGVILCLWIPITYASSAKMEAMGLAAVMSVSLAYLGGVSAYAATLRAKQGGVETTKVTEQVPVARITETTVETPPLSAKPTKKGK